MSASQGSHYNSNTDNLELEMRTITYDSWVILAVIVIAAGFTEANNTGSHLKQPSMDAMCIVNKFKFL